MPGKHAPASPRSFYVSAGKAAGAALGAVVLMVIAVLFLTSRGGTHPTGSPAIDTSHPTSSVETPSTGRTPTSTPTATPSLLPPASVSVHVQNGTAHSGLGKRTADTITAAGYKVAKVDNAPSHLAKSTIFYKPGARQEALAFQRAFPHFRVLKESASETTILRVVIGGDYPSS